MMKSRNETLRPTPIITRLKLPLKPTGEFSRLYGLMSKILELNAELRMHPWRCFGLELRSAFRLQATKYANAIPYRLLSGRPASEPILFAYTDRLGTDDLGLTEIQDLATALSGKPIQPRFGDMRTAPNADGDYVLYPEAGLAAGWMDRLVAQGKLIENDFVHACYCYAEPVLSHPFNDANGRVSRALFYGALVRRWGLTAPVLPMGTATYAFRPELNATLITLGTRGEWQPFIDIMAEITAFAIGLAVRDGLADEKGLITSGVHRQRPRSANADRPLTDAEVLAALETGGADAE